MRSLKTIRENTRLHTLLGTFLLSLFAGLPQSYADFDPVNDDTDIFLANPNVPSQRPNILLYIDNTANWNTAFTNEKNALTSVVNNLSDQFNLGLMMFPETGSPNDIVDGGYIRYGVRQMNTGNKNVMTGIVNGFNILNDKGNNNTLSLGMGEVYRYLSGGNPRSGHGKIKSDYASNTDEPGGHPATNAGLSGHVLPASPTATSTYDSPIVDSCQSNFLIYISNGGANENAASLAIAEAELAALGYDTSGVIALTPNGQQGNWMDEWARYMANADINTSIGGDQHLTTYVVEVDPVTTGQGPDMTALMKSVALNGDGEYFAVSSGNNGQAIINALNQIFTEIQAVNSVFASTTLPVSVNVRGTNLNQVYIGVFRPDESKSPRWFGNLKMYKLGFDTATSTLFLADATGAAAENPETGFINASASSFWTASTNYWSFRTAEENGAGGSSDLPDGDLVEKGGAAQNLRLDFDDEQLTRDLYTCTGTCPTTTGSSLSATEFLSTNTDITNAALGLGTTAVSTLTGFETKTVEAITDTFTVSSASTATGGATITLVTDAVGQTITALSTSNSSTITVANDGASSQSFDDLNRGTNPKNPVFATINGHGYSTGTIVHIVGVADAEYNGTFSITKVDNNIFKYDTGNSNPAQNPTFAGATVTTTSSILTVTAAGHGLTDPATDGNVTITGITPTDYNSSYSSWSVSGDDISITLASPLAPITAFAGAQVFGGALATATATVTGHGYTTNDSVIIDGATETGYDGSHTIIVTGTDTFTFTLGSLLAADNSATARAFEGNATVTATGTAHGFTNGMEITISGTVDTGYGGAFVISNATANTFDYTTLALPANTGSPVTAAAGVSIRASAVIPGHKFVVGDVLDFAGATPTDYNGTHTIAEVDGDTVRYSVSPATPAAAVAAFTAQRTVPTAYASLTGHGYTTGNVLTIEGAVQADYNVSNATITVLDTDTFTYPISSNVDADASGAITSSLKTTTARARVVTHGFVTNDSVTIAGATPTAFNGAFTITKVDDNNFTYTIASAQGDAAGSILASSGTGSASARDNLIEWVRGGDNFEDENADTTATSPFDIRSSSHGDVLHSRPAVVNYNRHGNDDDVYIFYGANDAIFRGVKGGFNLSLTGQPEPGHEDWGFIPQEFFSSLQRLRNNEPTISSSNKKPYFADGTIGVLAEDNSGAGGANVPDGTIDVTTDDNTNPDRVHIYISMRRGGRFIYALDVSDPSDPKLLWRKANTDSGFAELGQSWSAPRVLSLAIDTDGAGAADDDDEEDVILFGAGYDPTVEDVDPTTITAVSSTTVTAGAATYTRSMGRGMFLVDAGTGTILWQAGPVGGDPGTGHPYVEVVGMDYAIPSDITVLTHRTGSVDNRAYVGDTGGNVWRVDMSDSNTSNWTVTKLASVADVDGTPALAEGMRKFLFPPDVVYSEDGYDAVLIGSGDREHPFDSEVENRFYMFKDTGTVTTATIDTTVDNDAGTTTPSSPANAATILESDLFDATDNCLQDATACATDSGVTDVDGSGTVDQADASQIVQAGKGWYITLNSGEKVVGGAVTLNAVTFFNTNQPESTASVTDCSSNLGIARQYKVVFDDATAIADENIDGSTDAADRSKVHAGGGYLPTPVPVVVEIDGKIHTGVISGVAVDEPPGTVLDARLRKFWYKEIE